MFNMTPITGASQEDSFHRLPGFPLDPANMQRQAPDSRWLGVDCDGQPAGRCSLWWTQTPALDGQRLGYIGHFAVTDGSAAVPLLDRACSELAAHGCTLAVGPIDGNTWQRYRFITERGDEPPFFLEPDNPDEWPGLFLAAGFMPLAQYCSALNSDLAVIDSRMTLAAQQVHDRGIIIRPIEADQFDAELRRIHALSLLSFRDNFLYTPIGEQEFVEMYSAIRPYLRPDLVLLAERKDELLGFIFAMPDLNQAKRGEPMDTVIVKTMAIHPEHAGFGLGGVLMARVQEAAHRAGFRRAIHALFHEDNRSGRISGRTAKVFRRYTLYTRRL